MVLHGNIAAQTHAGKHEAICEVILRNTLLLSDISIATKHLKLAMEKGCQLEASYFKKQLASHCYDLLYPSEGGLSQLLMIMLRRFNNDLVKPQKKLKALIQKRNEIIRINRANFPYFKRLKHRIVLTKRKGNALQQYQVIDTINADEVLSKSGGFIEAFIDLNTLLVDLLQYLNTTENKYSGENN